MFKWRTQGKGAGERKEEGTRTVLRAGEGKIERRK